MTPAFHIPALLLSLIVSSALTAGFGTASAEPAPLRLMPEASSAPVFARQPLDLDNLRPRPHTSVRAGAGSRLLFETLPGLETYLEEQSTGQTILSHVKRPVSPKIAEIPVVPDAAPAEHYPWRENIVTTTFWVGEGTTPRNPVANRSSCWDPNWARHYGGTDDPNARANYIPVKFKPRQNPFYCALPYNDVVHGATKPEASKVIPWFRGAFKRSGKTVLKDRWIAIRFNGKVAYAQWEDAGPFRTDHWQYVFGNERPKMNLNKGAGLDVSPAVRDYLGMNSTDVTDWRFVDFSEVPRGPWATYGDNNTFVLNARSSTTRTVLATDVGLTP